MRGYTYSHQQIRAFIPTIREHIKNGQSLKSACILTGVDRGTIFDRLTKSEFNALREYRKSLEPKSTVRSNQLMADIITSYACDPNQTYKVMSENFGVSIFTIKRAIDLYTPIIRSENTEIITIQSKV